MTKKEFLEKREAINAKMANLDTMSDDYARCQRELTNLNLNYQAELLSEQHRGGADFGEQEKALRTFLRERKEGVKFELKRETVTGMTTTSTSAVIPNNIQAVIDKPQSATVYDLAGTPVITGATGLTDWVYAGDADVKIQEQLTQIDTAGTIDLTKKTATQQRLTVKIIVSNQAINNSAINLMDLINRKIDEGYRRAINFAAVSTAKFGANFYGGFAHTDKQAYQYEATGFTHKDAMAMVAKVAGKDFDVTSGVFVMGPETYFELKSTPKDAGSGVMTIDANGRLDGFPVLMTTAINKPTASGKATTTDKVGFGLFKNLPCLQHGSVRLTIDATSAAAGDIDGVIVVCNADWSMTNLFPESFVLASKKG